MPIKRAAYKQIRSDKKKRLRNCIVKFRKIIFQNRLKEKNYKFWFYNN